MRKMLFFFIIICLAIVSCSLPGSTLKGSGSSAKDEASADRAMDYPPEDYLLRVDDIAYDFTEPGTYTWKSSFQNAYAKVIIIGGGGGGGGSASYDKDPLQWPSDDRGCGGAGGGAGQVLETFSIPAYLNNYTLTVGSGGAGGRRGGYEQSGHRGADGTYSEFTAIRGDFGRGGNGGDCWMEQYSEGGYGYPGGEEGYTAEGRGGLGGDNGFGRGRPGSPAANGNDGHPAPANSGGGGGGASGAQYCFKGNYGGTGGSGRVLLTVSGTVKAYRIQNRWTGEYLYEKTDPTTGTSAGVAAGYVPSTMNTSWWMEEYVAEFETVRLKNLATGHYMNIENPALAYVGCGTAPLGWYSAQWYLDEVDGYKRIRNLWKGTAIHVENHTGMGQIGVVPAGYYSSQWSLVPLNVYRYYATWKNRVTGAYLCDQPGSDLALLSYYTGTPPETIQWILGETGGYYYMPVNRATGDSLNIEVRDGQARSTDVPPGFISSHWTLEKSDGYFRLKNRWTGEYLFQNASGVAEYSATPPTLESSQWVYGKVVP